MEIQIDTKTILQHIRGGKALGGKDGALAPLIKQLTEAALQAEIESHLTQDLQKNRKNGFSSKTMKSEVGSFLLHFVRNSKLRNSMFQEIEPVHSSPKS